MKAVVQKLLAVLLAVVLVLGNLSVDAQVTNAETFDPEVVVLLVAGVNVVPEASTAVEEAATYPASFEWQDESIFTAVSDLVVGTVVVTYEDASEDLLDVDVRVVETLNEAALNDPIGTTELISGPVGTVPDAGEYIVNRVVLPAGTVYEWTDPTVFETAGENLTATVRIIYPDSSFDEMPLLVTVVEVLNDAALYDPIGTTELISGPVGTVPDAGEYIVNRVVLPAGTVYEWTDPTVFETAGENLTATVRIIYPDTSFDEMPLLVTVEEPEEPTEAEIYTPRTIDLLTTTVNVVPAATDAMANLDELPADVVVTWQDEIVFSEVKTEINENVIVTYADGSSDMLPVLVTVLPVDEPEEPTEAETYTPRSQAITTELGVYPAAIDAIANLDELPDKVKFTWQDESIFDQLGENIETIVLVTYPDGSIDELKVVVSVIEDLTPESEASLYTPRSVALVTTMRYVVPMAKAAIENIDELPNDAVFTWEDESVFETVAAAIFTNLVVTYADGSVDIVAVPVTVTEAQVATHARVIVHFVDLDGSRLLPSQIDARKIGSTYQTTRVSIDGYVLDSIVGQEKGIVAEAESKNTVTYVYRKLVSQPQLPNTGEATNVWLYGLGVLALVGGVGFLLIAYRKRRGN